MKLLDSDTDHNCHGIPPYTSRYSVCRKYTNIVTDIDRHPSPLRNSPHELPSQTSSHLTRIPRTPFSHPRRQSPQQRTRRFDTWRVRISQRVSYCCIPERRIPQRPWEPWPTTRKPHVWSSRYGGYDGYDEGEHDDDDSADVDYELDQCFLFGLCYLYGSPTLSFFRNYRLTMDSKTAFPSDDPLQVHASIWRCDSRSWCAMGIEFVMVFP